MKELFLTDWNLMRMLRVIGGFALIVVGITKHDTISGAFGFFLPTKDCLMYAVVGEGIVPIRLLTLLK
jgi:uncharacterized membrane protein YuzA (DUF378 family)